MILSLKAAPHVRLAVILAAGASLAACASVQPRYPSQAGAGKPGAVASTGVRKVGQPYQVNGIWYVPREQPDYDQRGVASWYGQQFHLKATANGEVFDMNAVSAAHTTLPLPSMVEVTNLDNGRRLTVRVNDRGPFHDNRIIDLSQEAAIQLGFHRQGLANVRVRYVGPAPLTGRGEGVRVASAAPYAAAPAAAPWAATARAEPSPAQAYRPPAREAITENALPPVTGAAISDTPIPPATPPAPYRAYAAAPPGLAASSALRIQAGAFSNPVNAQRAVDQLSTAGSASIETLQLDGRTLYRVVLPAPADEAAAYALRDRVAEIGFTEARVVRTF
ncbi:septal ring lytic transglycosylase RlpA family protein [Phenylobacterium sp.]|uniref:septal ring lytic transglycosylase RlpA family protein n=1 Tax=Phenylobacterium sp. TaxID=1871053 RepID=UPI00301DDA11